MFEKHRRRRPTLRVFKILGSRQSWRCGSCNAPFDSIVEVDHKIPLMKGGTNEIENLEVLCVVCHAFKSQEESIEPYMTEDKAMHCRTCKAVFSRYFTHTCS